MYTQILVAVDGSSTSDRALQHAASLARLSGARLNVLHVVETLGSGFERPEIFQRDVLPKLIQDGEKLLRNASLQVGSGVAINTLLIEDSGNRTSQHIVDQAKVCGADLIVLGTHGRRGVNRMLMGSDAEQVARTAPVPVMLVRDLSTD